MAEGSGEEENAFHFHSYTRKDERNFEDGSDDAEKNGFKPSFTLGKTHTADKKEVTENQGSGVDMPKKEENPFSFKHFLKCDAGNSSISTGARPKVYSSLSSEDFGHLMPDSSDPDPGLHSRSAVPHHIGNPEITSLLPDFVQDHLVVEQCYLNHTDSSNSPPVSVDLENLPDFTINNTTPACETADGDYIRINSQWSELKRVHSDVLTSDIPFDLTGTTRTQNLQRNFRNGLESVPLDLPSSDRGSSANTGISAIRDGGLPFDLPLITDSVDGTANTSLCGVRSGIQIGEVGVKSLPDFLSDGPIYSGRHSDVAVPVNDTTGTSGSSSILRSQSPDTQRLQLENERLRRKLDVVRRQLADETRRVQYLEQELLSIRSKEHEETVTLEKAIEQVEDNLKRTTRRAVTAENCVSKLKQELDLVMSELTLLRQENREFRCRQAGAGRSFDMDKELQSQRLGKELRTAAGTAERLLRQLLTGVGNLHVIASTLENSSRIQDHTGDFYTHLDGDGGGGGCSVGDDYDDGEDDANGPAL